MSSAPGPLLRVSHLHTQFATEAGLVRAKRIKQWTFYQRDEAGIRKFKRALVSQV